MFGRLKRRSGILRRAIVYPLKDTKARTDAQRRHNLQKRQKDNQRINWDSALDALSRVDQQVKGE